MSINPEQIKVPITYTSECPEGTAKCKCKARRRWWRMQLRAMRKARR